MNTLRAEAMARTGEIDPAFESAHYMDGRDLKCADSPAGECRVAAPMAVEQAWMPIETAPKTLLDHPAEVVIMGFAPDEEGFSPTSREGFWSPTANEWRFYGDPTWKNPPQPTHWQPLLAPPLPVIATMEKAS